VYRSMVEQPAIIQHPYSNLNRRYTAIRIVKNSYRKIGNPSISFAAPPSAEVRILDGDIFAAESEADYYFYFEHNVQEQVCTVQFQISWPQSAVKAIISEKSLLDFQQQDGQVQFELDLKDLQGRSTSLDYHSFFREPGLSVGIYQNHPMRNVGKFASMIWPQIQIDAAEHYIFATREVLKALGITDGLVRDDLGYVELLSFETSNAYHGDYPPHWHIIYRWTNYAGSQAPHIYMDEQGRNTHNLVTIDGVPKVRYEYKADEWCYFQNEYSREAFAIQICPDGGLAITKRDAEIYKLLPYHTERGVEVVVDQHIVGAMHVHNDPASGVMSIRWSRVDNESNFAATFHERIQYDPLFGTITKIEK